MKVLLKLVCITITTSLLLCGCGTTPKQVAYKTLSAIGAAGNAAGDAVALAYSQNKLNETQWQKAKEKYANFQVAYNNACREAGMSLDAPPTTAITYILNDWLMFADSLLKGTP